MLPWRRRCRLVAPSSLSPLHALVARLRRVPCGMGPLACNACCKGALMAAHAPTHCHARCREARDEQLAAWLWRWSATAVGLQPADDLPPCTAG